jgi:sensor histidine kinase YesM
LTVKIKYDEDKEKEDYKFTIEDNAYGMNDEELAEAIMPKNQNTNAGELGAHGVGMKLALF